MQQSANILFQVALKHSFFKDGLLRGLSFEPTQSGKKQLALMQAQGHRYLGGNAVFAPKNLLDSGISEISPAVKATNVAFELKVTDVDFLNFTDVQELGPGMVFYGSNLNDPNVPVQLSTMQVRRPQWSINLENLLPAQLDGQRRLKITRLNGVIVIDRSYLTRPSDCQCNVDLSDESDGAYSVAYTAGGKTIELPFFKWDSGLQHSALGFFEWFGCQDGISGRSTPLGEQWTLQFQARTTYWQYYLVQGSGLPLRNPTISPVTVGTNLVSFSQTNDNVVLPNGRHALEFTSDAELPLQESPKMAILLEATGFAKGMQLPYPSSEVLYAAATPAARNSKIYVYF